MQSRTLGDFLDLNKSMLELSLSPGGTMSFVQIDKDKNLATFELSTGDFKAMDAAIAELSPYFTY